MYGSDEPLLRIRAKVLSTIACDTQVFQHEQEAADSMAANQPQPNLIILCHSADEEGAERLRNLALKAGVPTYTVERLVPPQQLIEDVNRVLKRGKGSQKAARACP